MLRLPGPATKLCDGITRRDLLQAGTLGGLGLSLPSLFDLQSSQAAAPRPRADACILIFLWGSPSQFETFDPKPDAPDGIRGEFGVRRTSVPGTIVSEYIPRLAARAHRFALVRTCSQSSTHHQSAAYEALTGHPPTRDAVALTATPNDHPNLGSVVARLATGDSELPRSVSLPQLISDVGNLTPGQFGGFLGRRYDPFAVTSDPNRPDFHIDALRLQPSLDAGRLRARNSLRTEIDRQVRLLGQSAEERALDIHQARAVRLLTSPAVQQAFAIGREPERTRALYGRNTFGQSCLLARRLVESGVKLVTVFSAQSGKIPQDAWDTHKDNFRRHRDELLPPMDRGVAALLDDLHERGLAERTLVLWMGEFGRTPRINTNAGRDHWAQCYTVMLAGGGVRPGQAHGRSDRHGAFPLRGRVFTPADICATVYHCLGIDPHTEVIDALGRPVRISEGRVMTELF